MYSGKDIHPFNIFDLTCTARKPGSVIPPLQLSWYHNGMQLDASVTGTTIREEEMNNGMEKSSFLSITSALTSNPGAYTCSAVISIPDSTTITNNQSATVTIAGTKVIMPSSLYLLNNYINIIGPSAPIAPNVLRTVPYSTQALVSWTVTAISYTSEMYFIEYGQSNDTLNLRSEIIAGSGNLTSTNLAYSANITGLRPFTLYYYRVVARNSFTRSETSKLTIQTSEAGIYAEVFFVLVIMVYGTSLIAPTGPPESLSIVSTTSRNVTLSWASPQESERNGMIVGYMVACVNRDGSAISTLTTTSFSITVGGLSPYSFYMCSVTASTSIGNSPEATLNFTTATDCKM